jgi:hypothetical protein
MELNSRKLKIRNGVRTIAVWASCAVLVPAAACLAGCSVYMEATRPTPVDLTQFQTGESRDSVIEQLGSPTATATEADGASCDSYHLYTRGYGAGGKVPIAVLEGAADVFTLGLAEAITTPVEGATKNQVHPVTFCYTGGKLVRLVDRGQVIASTTAPEPAQSSSSALATNPVETSASAVTGSTAGAGSPVLNVSQADPN